MAVGYEDNAASVAWQVDRLRDELGGAEVVVREGVGAEPLWSALTEFPAMEAGPVSFLANVRPSSVVALVKDLDPGRWAIQATPAVGSSVVTPLSPSSSRHLHPSSIASAASLSATAAT